MDKVFDNNIYQIFYNFSNGFTEIRKGEEFTDYFNLQGKVEFNTHNIIDIFLEEYKRRAEHYKKINGMLRRHRKDFYKSLIYWRTLFILSLIINIIFIIFAIQKFFYL